MFKQRLSVKTNDITFLNAKTKRQIITATHKPIKSEVEIKAPSFFSCFILNKFAVVLLTISGNPLDMKVSKTIKTENEIWYIPSSSAPITRDKKILNKKPSALVKTENEVKIANALKRFFINLLLKKCVVSK